MKKRKTDPGQTMITAELIEQAKAGDQVALTALYEATSLDVYRTIHAMVRDEDTVLDIQQDTYLKAFQRLDQLQDPTRFSAWIQRIAVNEAKNQLIRKKPLLFSELIRDDAKQAPLGIPDKSPLPEDALDQKETKRLVDEILQTLTPEQQLVVGMHYYEQIPATEIAKSLGVSANTVYTQLHRGRKRIESGVRKLEQQGIKLYGLSPVAYLMALLKKTEPPEESCKRVLGAVVGKTAAPAASVGLKVSSGFFHTLLGKLLLGAAAAVLLGGGVIAYREVSRLNRPEVLGDYRETLPVETESEDRLAVTREADPEFTVTEPSEEPTEASTEPTETTEPSEPPEVPEQPPVQEDQPPAVPDQPPAQEQQAPAEQGEQPGPAEPEPSEPEPSEPEPSEPEESTEPEPSEPEEPENACGANLTWSFDAASATLTITGSGPMNDNWDSDSMGKSTLPFSKTDVRSIMLPEGMTYISQWSFKGYSGLSVVNIPNTVKIIGEYAFSGCSGLTAVNIPGSVTSIGGGAFYGCSGLTAVNIPGSVTSIGGGAFSDCSGLTAVTIPGGVKTIAGATFSNCTSLTTVTIPAGVTWIGNNAFENCSSLTDVYFGGSEADWNAILFGAGNDLLLQVNVHFAAEAP